MADALLPVIVALEIETVKGITFLGSPAAGAELISVGDQVGPCLKAVWGNPDHYDVILLGHMDTVFPMGTVKNRPFSIEGDHYKGPGSADMKCGDLFMVYLAEAVSRENLQGNLCLLFNPDEEISSRYSRPVIEREARKADHALCAGPTSCATCSPTA